MATDAHMDANFGSNFSSTTATTTAVCTLVIPKSTCSASSYIHVRRANLSDFIIVLPSVFGTLYTVGRQPTTTGRMEENNDALDGAPTVLAVYAEARNINTKQRHRRSVGRLVYSTAVAEAKEEDAEK